jgi:hypothetical protein
MSKKLIISRLTKSVLSESTRRKMISNGTKNVFKIEIGMREKKKTCSREQHAYVFLLGVRSSTCGSISFQFAIRTRS